MSLQGKTSAQALNTDLQQTIQRLEADLAAQVAKHEEHKHGLEVQLATCQLDWLACQEKCAKLEEDMQVCNSFFFCLFTHAFGLPGKARQA